MWAVSSGGTRSSPPLPASSNSARDVSTTAPPSPIAAGSPWGAGHTDGGTFVPGMSGNAHEDEDVNTSTPKNSRTSMSQDVRPRQCGKVMALLAGGIVHGGDAYVALDDSSANVYC